MEGEACSKGASWFCNPAAVGSIPILSTKLRVRSVCGGTPGFQPGRAGSTPAGRTIPTRVAQPEECLATNQEVGGSSPPVGAEVLVAQGKSIGLRSR